MAEEEFLAESYNCKEPKMEAHWVEGKWHSWCLVSFNFHRPTCKWWKKAQRTPLQLPTLFFFICSFYFVLPLFILPFSAWHSEMKGIYIWLFGIEIWEQRKISEKKGKVLVQLVLNSYRRPDYFGTFKWFSSRDEK